MYAPTSPEEFVNYGTNYFEFSNTKVRNGFIRKVYGLLFSQLLVTFGFIALFTYHTPTKLYVQEHEEVYWVSLAVLLVCFMSMACCPNLRREPPVNYIFLFIFTLAQSFMLGAISSRFDTEAVLMAVGVTAVVCFALTIFSLQTKWDFTGVGVVLLIGALVVMIIGLVALFVPSKTLIIVYASLGALLFCAYLMYDTQLMLGGKHRYTISPEEYIFATLCLYLDIINIFLFILTLFGISKQ